MTNDTTANMADRMNKLAVETTQTFIDAAYLAQRQSAQLLQAWLNTLDANQQEQRTIAARLIQQAQEAQNLLQQYVQESSRAGAEAFTKATQQGMNAAEQNVRRASQATSQATKETTSAK